MQEPITIRLDVTRRPGGTFYARCAQVPGLHVIGESLAALQSTAAVAVKDLFKRNRGLDVEVAPREEPTELRVHVLGH